MQERYWLVLPNGGRQMIDPHHFDIDALAERARRIGGRLVVEGVGLASATAGAVASVEEADLAPPLPPRRFEPPVSALAPLFRARLAKLYFCKHPFDIDMNVRPTSRMLGGYYRRRALVRVYTHDLHTGRRPIEELFDTFLHEIAHHIEYTEPQSFHAETCQRVRGTMHSDLFWSILGHLKRRWAQMQAE